ncbi:MAG: PEGA domain-containing protein, partial [Myxococcota bacterium]
ATLRILDADRQELLFKVPAEGARIELPAGRVVLDVRREDCPDPWTQSVFFEEGETHRFEPQLCRGFGNLALRSNVTQNRVRIDGLEMGSTALATHRLRVGDHEIRVDKAGYRSFTGMVRIRPNEEHEIYAELTEAGTARGRPMPVTRHAPTREPALFAVSQSPNLSALGASMVADQAELNPERLLPLDRFWADYGGATPGSTRWHDRLAADMISRYDNDASGQIDQFDESEAISCPTWREIEEDFNAGGLGLSLVRYFGFDGSEWHPNALGFARDQRSLVFEKMKACGLQS